VDGVGNAVSNASAGLVTISTGTASTTPATEVVIGTGPGAGAGVLPPPPSGAAPVLPSTDPQAASSLQPLAPLGLPVDPTVGASSMGIRASADQLLRPATPAFDLNALPPTAAGVLDPFGFPVERMSLDRANQLALNRGELPLIGHYLFEYRGVPELSPDGRIPVDAFAHTDPAAVVRLTARLADGSPLPSWLRLDARGAFVGMPPQDLEGTLEVEVVASDTEGREARTAFSLDIGAMRAAAGATDFVLGVDVDKEEAKKAKAEREKFKKAAPQTFSEQMRVAKGKADPLLDKILGKAQDKPRQPR
jgi:hypothetical protein